MRTNNDGSGPNRPRLPARLVLACAALAGILGFPTVVAAQAADSATLATLHQRQREFEAFRVSRTPIEKMSRPSGVCDEWVGTICIWFGGEEEAAYPTELREVGQARTQLIRELSTAYGQAKDRWILGQLVHYLVENRNMDEALGAASTCAIDEAWWCAALRGYVLHVWTRHPESEEAFAEALDAMPDSVHDAWTLPRYLVTDDALRWFTDAPAGERDRRVDLFWQLSDPLFLLNGNDRRIDHFARMVVAENRRDAADPMGVEWRPETEEALIRYGRNTGYGRVQDLDRMRGGNLQDTRRMVGHHHPKSRGYLFPERFLESPADIPPETWITAPREARTWYAVPYAPDMRGLETQVGRFRRDDLMLVVGAYRPTLPDAGGGVVDAWGAEGGIEGTPHAALALISVDGDAPLRMVRGEEPEGVLTVEAAPGRYVSSLEVVDLEGRQAWRARQGVQQAPLAPGSVDVSDLMILREGAELPESLEDAIPDVRPGVRLRAGERFTVVWEAYGLAVQEPVRVTLGFNRGRPGFLTRVGEFLGVIEPDQTVDITFDDSGPDRVQEVFRAVRLELPDLEPGAYTLHLRLELTGREPITASRPIVVEG